MARKALNEVARQLAQTTRDRLDQVISRLVEIIPKCYERMRNSNKYISYHVLFDVHLKMRQKPTQYAECVIQSPTFRHHYFFFDTVNLIQQIFWDKRYFDSSKLIYDLIFENSVNNRHLFEVRFQSWVSAQNAGGHSFHNPFDQFCFPSMVHANDKVSMSSADFDVFLELFPTLSVPQPRSIQQNIRDELNRCFNGRLDGVTDLCITYLCFYCE